MTEQDDGAALRIELGQARDSLAEQTAQLESADTDLAAANAALRAETDARERGDQTIARLNEELEGRLVELSRANRELEAFSYSVAHDLRAPLRAMDGFSRILLEDHGNELSSDARRYCQLIRDNAQHMGQLIDGLLRFSRLSRQALEIHPVDPTALARQALSELEPDLHTQQAQIVLNNLPHGEADPTLLRQVFANLLGNAIKFSRLRVPARIEIGSTREDGDVVYFVRDNGVGFDMRYAGRLFGVFERLHRAEDYEGAGVGLAISRRIIERHGGRIWADAKPEAGATFYFTLGKGSGDDRTD